MSPSTKRSRTSPSSKVKAGATRRHPEHLAAMKTVEAQAPKDAVAFLDQRQDVGGVVAERAGDPVDITGEFAMAAQDRAERAAEGKVLVENPRDQRLVGVVPHLLVEYPDELLLRREHDAAEIEGRFVRWRFAPFRHPGHARLPCRRRPSQLDLSRLCRRCAGGHSKSRKALLANCPCRPGADHPAARDVSAAAGAFAPFLPSRLESLSMKRKITGVMNSVSTCETISPPTTARPSG
jgi:hypothetical protein